MTGNKAWLRSEAGLIIYLWDFISSKVRPCVVCLLVPFRWAMHFVPSYSMF